jgi:AraC-like DNA-binding protein
MELLRARYLTQTFPRHTHEQYAIGVIESGALGFYYRGENVVAPQGQINLCIPGEVHTGQAATDSGWSYRMFYFDPELLRRVAGEIAGRPRDIPFFRTGVIDDPELARRIRKLHVLMEQQDVPLLEQETALLWTLGQMVIRHADDPPVLQKMKREKTAVSHIRRYIRTHYAQNLSIDDLALAVHRSPYHIIHIFCEEMSVPPHAYLRQVRIRKAKELLSAGLPIADAAHAVGFTDQSHLNRWFKRLWGITPGQYRNSVQYK